MIKEKEHLYNVFVVNGYPEDMTRISLTNNPKAKAVSQTEEEGARTNTLCLPYIQGLSIKVEKVLKDLDIRTVFKTTLTLRRSLTKVKTPPDLVNTKRVVYKIPCECGRVYVHESERTLKQRITEHKRAVKNADSNNGLAVHVASTEHKIRWEEAEVVHREEQWTKRKIKESFSTHANNLNLDAGVPIDSNWFSTS